MSTIEDLGARLRAATDDLPLGLVTRALDHLRVATDALRWVRQESRDPLGVPELSVATEHAQMAGHALLVAQDRLGAYLAAIGLAADGAPARRPDRPSTGDGHDGRRDHPAPDHPPRPAADRATVSRWWSSRMIELIGRDDPPAPDTHHRAADAGELLRRVARRVHSGDRARLYAELRAVDADIGLGLTAVAAPVLRRLTGELLGHPPRVRDLPRLHGELAGPLRDLLPGLPPAVLDTLLSRLCRTPPPKARHPLHPADQPVAAGILTGLLLHRLGHEAPDPSPHEHG